MGTVDSATDDRPAERPWETGRLIRRRFDGHGQRVERAGRAARRGLDQELDGRGLGSSHVLALGGPPGRRALVRPSPIRRRRPEEPGERPLRPVEGPRVAPDLLRPEGGRRDRRRAAAVVPSVRVAGAGTPRPAPRDAVDRRRDRVAGPGSADRARDGARDEDGRHPGPRLVPDGRLRGRRGLGVGGDGERLAPRGRQPDRDHRREPAGPTRPHDAPVGPGDVRRSRAFVRLASDRGRRSRRRRDRRRVHRGGGFGRAGDRDRQDREGAWRLVPGEPGGMARQGAVAGGSGSRDRRARRAARRLVHAAQARGRGLAAGRRTERGAAGVRGGDRDTEGVR